MCCVLVLGLWLAVPSPAAGPVEESQEAKEAIDATIAAYRGLKTYQCTHERVWTIKTRDGDKNEQTTTTRVFLEAPAKFAIVSPDHEIRSDGTTLSVRMPVWKQYMSQPVGDAATLDDRLRTLTQGREGLPLVVEAMLRPDAAVPELWGGVKGFTGISEGVSAGAECWWVSAVIDDAAYKSGLTIDQRISIDRGSKMIVRTVADFAMAARATMPTVESAVYATTNRDIAVNQPIDAAIFVFVPAADERLVTAFEAPPEPVEPPPAEAPAVAGGDAAPAPGFAVKDLDGKEATLASFKGRVVVLDFWATWCGPCIAAMPAMVHLADSMKDKPVVMLGVNVDQPGMEAKIRQVLAKKDNSMRQLLDSAGAMSRDYGADAIPMVVVIDQEGKLRHRHVGYSPRLDEKIAKEIDALLAEKAGK